MPDSLHLLISDAALSGGDARRGGKPASAPDLPNLRALLARMVEEGAIAVDDDSPADPLEVALARARGLPDAPGRAPWAAWESQTFGPACAWLVPVHLQAGMNDVRLSDPVAAPLLPEQSDALMQSCARLLAEDGIGLRAARSAVLRADAWLAQGDWLDGLICWSPRRAAGRSLLPGQLLRADDAARQGRLLRLVSELQMLLHAHPVNEARERAGQDPINALWICGAGRLMQPLAPTPGVTVAWELSDQSDQPQDRAQAWQALDAGLLADWRARVDDAARRSMGAGVVARLTLCGPRRARTWALPARGALSLGAVVRRWLRPVSLSALLERL